MADQKLVLVLVLLTFSSSCHALNLENGHPVVRTAAGPLRGTVLKSRDGRDFYSFKGIKYGVIPQRFALSKPVEPWTEVRDTLEYGSTCPAFQLFMRSVEESSEDCLFLNVFTAATKDDEKLPVMFWIHGGGFIAGASSEYGPEFLMDEQVILVTINYRLGALGFLNTEDGTIPANNGMKDMILALKWVQRNIEAFGGDPKRVTIFGESAGGAAVHHLMLSPAAKGLFHGVIAMSGTAFCPWALVPTPSAFAKELGANVGCPTSSSKELVECLRNAPLDQVMIPPDSAEEKVIANITMGPSIEDPAVITAPDYAFLPAHPAELLTKHEDNSKRVPLISGVIELDGLILSHEILETEEALADFDNRWEQRAPIHFVYNRLVKTGREKVFGNVLRVLYFGGQGISKKTTKNLVDLYTDIMFSRGSRLAVDLHALQGGRAYSYEFSYKGESSIADAMNIKDSKGPTHCDELRYLFSNITAFNLPWQSITPGSKDEKFSKKFVSLWVSFAAEGRPSRSWGDSWKPVTPSNVDMAKFPELNIGKKPKLIVNGESYKRYAKLDALIAANEVHPLSWRRDRIPKDEL